MLHNLQSLYRHPYIRGSSVNFLGSLGVNFLSYLFNIIIGRMLGPALYSEYFALISIWYLAALPSAVLQTALTKQIAHYAALGNKSELNQALQVGFKLALQWGVGVGFVLMLCAPLILSALRIDNLIAYTLLILLIALSYLVIPFFSLYIAKEKYLTFSLLSGSSILIRVIAVIPLLFIHTSIEYVFLAMLLGNLCQLGLSTLMVHRELQSEHLLFTRIRSYLRKLTHKALFVEAVHKDIMRTLQTSFIATLGLAALTQVDVIISRARLSVEDAGIYASLAVTGKIIPFFTLPLIGVLLPQITAKLARKEDYQSTILLAAALVGLGSGSVALFYALFPEFVVQIFLGDQFSASAAYLGSFGIFQTLYALTSLVVMTCIAANRIKAASAVLLAALIQSLTLLLLPPNIPAFITASIIILTITIIYYAFILLYKKDKKSEKVHKERNA